MDSLLNQTHVYSKIYNLRGVQVMIDRDLAEIYGVETKYLKRQVQRNIERFNEEDFMFVLTKNELDDFGANLAPQISKKLEHYHMHLLNKEYICWLLLSIVQ